jgi:hypothetical protein
MRRQLEWFVVIDRLGEQLEFDIHRLWHNSVTERSDSIILFNHGFLRKV